MKSKEKPIRIDVGLTGGVELIDVDAFFQHEKVKKTMKRLREMDLAGKTIVGNKLIPTAELEKKENGS